MLFKILFDCVINKIWSKYNIKLNIMLRWEWRQLWQSRDQQDWATRENLPNAENIQVTAPLQAWANHEANEISHRRQSKCGYISKNSCVNGVYASLDRMRVSLLFFVEFIVVLLADLADIFAFVSPS